MSGVRKASKGTEAGRGLPRNVPLPTLSWNPFSELAGGHRVRNRPSLQYSGPWGKSFTWRRKNFHAEVPRGKGAGAWRGGGKPTLRRGEGKKKGRIYFERKQDKGGQIGETQVQLRERPGFVRAVSTGGYRDGERPRHSCGRDGDRAVSASNRRWRKQARPTGVPLASSQIGRKSGIALAFCAQFCRLGERKGKLTKGARP